jgi:hypothetical protein
MHHCLYYVIVGFNYSYCVNISKYQLNSEILKLQIVCGFSIKWNAVWGNQCKQQHTVLN